MRTRRVFSHQLLAVAAPALWAASASASAATRSRTLADDIAGRLRAIESRALGRLGVCIVDTADGASFMHRPDERFLMCSTFKLMAAALVLQRVDAGLDRLDRVVPYGKADLVPYSPVTGPNAVAGGMALGALCQATVTTSDNTAVNLMLHSMGGPPALTLFMRSLGDTVTRMDRLEPAVNRWQAGDARDTTSPRAMLTSMQRVLLGNALSATSREQLLAWLQANTTGGTRLRAGLPKTWRVGDKTGKADPGNDNDIGIVWPDSGAPLLVTAYLSESTAADAVQDRCIAEVGALLPLIARR